MNVMRFVVVILGLLTAAGYGQTIVPNGSSGGGGGGSSTASAIRSGLLAAIPATCAVADVYYATDATITTGLSKFYVCTATDTWTQTGAQGNADGSITITSSASGLIDIQVTPGVFSQAKTMTSSTGGYMWAFGETTLASNGTPAVGTTMNFAEFVPSQTIDAATIRIQQFTAAAGQYGSFCIYTNPGRTLLSGATAVDVSTAGGLLRNFTLSPTAELIQGQPYYLGWAASGAATWRFYQSNADFGTTAGVILNGGSVKKRFSDTTTITSPGASQTCPATMANGTQTAIDSILMPAILFLP